MKEKIYYNAEEVHVRSKYGKGLQNPERNE